MGLGNVCVGGLEIDLIDFTYIFFVVETIANYYYCY